ncbi:hypothetical protein HDU97_005813 [Phlyctochytrium planicorne]|nr:hypothetical protein HDU97_005813 [Phlyctochytrium planicorne]
MGSGVGMVEVVDGGGGGVDGVGMVESTGVNWKRREVEVEVEGNIPTKEEGEGKIHPKDTVQKAAEEAPSSQHSPSATQEQVAHNADAHGDDDDDDATNSAQEAEAVEERSALLLYYNAGVDGGSGEGSEEDTQSNQYRYSRLKKVQETHDDDEAVNLAHRFAFATTAPAPPVVALPAPPPPPAALATPGNAATISSVTTTSLASGPALGKGNLPFKTSSLE